MKILYTLILISLLTVSCQSQSKPFVFEKVSPESVDISSDSLAKMNAYFHNLVDENQLAGIQTAVIRKGKLVHFDTYGHADIAAGQKLNEKSIFRIFSMTKPIVSVGLMQLYEQGKFDLNDPVYKFIPAFKEQNVYVDSLIQPVKNPVRVIDLLRHTAGYNYGRGPNNDLNERYANLKWGDAKNYQEYLEMISELPLLFEPGTDWVYGISTNICGHLIEIISEMPLDKYLKQNILIPLEMHDTHFQVPENKVRDFTVGYGWSTENQELIISESVQESRFLNPVSIFNGGGGMVSTTYDYLNFCQMLLNQGTFNGNKILKKATIQLMLKDHLEEARKHHEQLRLAPGEEGFGLGFSIKGNPGEEIYGWGGAVGTYFKFDSNNEMAYVMMIQLSPHRQLGLRQRIQDFMNASIIH